MALGAVLGGKYRLEALLGKGGMGTVWRARNVKLDALVAVKLMDPSIASDEQALMRFHREARAGATLRSPHILQVFDHDVDPASGRPYIVMELLDGEPLSRRLERVGLSLAETEAVVRDVCRGLAVAHQHGVIHRDLKPDNVFLERNQDEELAKILDFGIAKSRAPELGPATQTGAVLGTPFYMSPEQIRGAKHVDARSDLWSVAVIVYECVTGRRPFHADTLGALAVAICTDDVRPVSEWVRVPPAVDAWFARALDRDPERRFQSAGELAQAFSQACALSPALGAVTTREPAPAGPSSGAASRSVARPVIDCRAPEPLATASPARPEVRAPAAARTVLEPPAPTPAPTRTPSPTPAPTPSREWWQQARHILLGYGFTLLIVVGVVGYNGWLQREAAERAAALSSGHGRVVEAPADFRSTVSQALRSWLPGTLVALGTLGVGLGSKLARRKASREP